MAVYNKSDFLRQADQLIPNDFLRLGSEAIYIKEENSKKIELAVTSANYFPHSVVFTGIVAEITFVEVETIFNEIYKSYELPSNSVIHPQTVNINLSNAQGVDLNFLYKNQVSNDNDFNTIRPMLESLIDESIVFFEQFVGLTQLYEYLENLDQRDKARFISQPFSFRYMIIKKLVNAEDFDSYAQNMIEVRRSKGDNIRADFAEALYEKLKTLDN